MCFSGGLAFSGTCNDVYSRNDFPEGFVFGSAFSAFQWEGAVDEDGRKPSIWDTYVHSHAGPTGDVACDGYHKYKEDVRLMYDMGLRAFRLSISWPRLIPNGRGPVNPKGLRFYKNLINELTRHGIEPHVTLHHNDLPQTLEDEYGGWINPKIIDDFTAFADVCFKEFGSSVKFWTTINEPNMLAWGGITCFAYWMVPFTSSVEDEIATQRVKDFYIGWVLNPLVFGDYPDVMKRIAGKRLPSFSEEESDLVKDSFDFLGLIHYTAMSIEHLSISRQGDYFSDINATMNPYGNSSLEEFEVLPWGLEGVLEYIKQNYGNPPVYILENGRPTNHHSSLHDVERVEYLHAYIAAVLNSVRNGSDTRGYFQWSFMDLYEFLNYNYTYGLYHVNFTDPERKRSPKTSALWYSALLKGSTVSSQVPKNLSVSSSPGFAYQ
ncbi:unnamed protein product [Thlaspi arvense]|uniref:Thioglucosidase n=1 Tax=Thlaspi arvense TaxID=13288 RepID=A0AAU9S0M1_THLAR|nr:unnamed protein product [Thlaspi arvense]